MFLIFRPSINHSVILNASALFFCILFLSSPHSIIHSFIHSFIQSVSQSPINPFIHSGGTRKKRTSYQDILRVGRMAEWLGCWILGPWPAGLSPHSKHFIDLLHASPEFSNPSAAFVNIQRVCRPPVGIHNHVMFHLQYLFSVV